MLRDRLKCRCCGAMKFDSEFVATVQQFLDDVTAEAGETPVISSGYRCPRHNAEVSEDRSTDGPHTIGAIDLLCCGSVALAVVRVAMQRYSGIFTGIGIKQVGPFERRFVHLDAAPAIPGRRPRPWIWTYNL